MTLAPAAPTHETGRPSRRTVVTVTAIVLALLLVGFLAGARSTWGAKHAHTVHGVAVRANDENGLVMFDGDDGSQTDFDLNSIWWTSESASGDRRPPCLTEPHRKVRVDVGVMRVARPEGGWFEHAVWVRCP